MTSGVVAEPGLVIPYVYLWRHQNEAGEDSRRKVRPCVVVIAVRRGAAGAIRVAVAPITTQSPSDDRSAVALPPRVKLHLGLDTRPSWMICDEYNEFDWPGVDRAVTSAGAPVFGYLPDTLLERIRAEMRGARERGALKGSLRSG